MKCMMLIQQVVHIVVMVIKVELLFKKYGFTGENIAAVAKGLVG